MKALVTGASGFLGGHLAEACLREGDDVRVLVRRSSDLSHLRTFPGLDVVYGDLTDEDAVREAATGVDVVYHSAARVLDYGRRQQFWDVNVVATQRLLEAAARGGAQRFVFVSSPSAVMTGEDQFGIDESQPYPRRFQNLYSETKAAAEQAVLAADSPGFTTCAIRPRGVWGPRDWNGFMPKIIAKTLAGKLPDLSGGRTVHTSLCHCDNAVAACLLAARSDRVGGKAYFVADGETTDVWRLISELTLRFGGQPPTRRVPPAVRDALVEAVELVWRVPYIAHRYSPPISRYSAALLTRSTTYDTSAAERDFGYRPVVDQATGIDRLLRWTEEIGGVDEFVRNVR